jgi:hypothetical protein
MHAARRRTLRRIATGEVRGSVRATRTSLMRRHSSSHVMGRRRSRTIRGTYSRVVLRPTPGKTNTRISNGIALHLIDSHLSGMTMDKLDKATALARRNLDIGDLSEALEERTKFIFRDVAREATDEDRGVVRIRELVHRLDRVEVAAAVVVVRRHTPSTHGTSWTTSMGNHLSTTSCARSMPVLMRAVTRKTNVSKKNKV